MISQVQPDRVTIVYKEQLEENIITKMYEYKQYRDTLEMCYQIHFTCDMYNKNDLCARGTRYLHRCRKYTGYSSKNAQQSIYLQDEKRNADWVNSLF